MRFALKCRANLFPEQAGRSSLLFREDLRKNFFSGNEKRRLSGEYISQKPPKSRGSVVQVLSTKKNIFLFALENRSTKKPRNRVVSGFSGAISFLVAQHGRGGHFRCRLQILQSKSFMRQFLYAKYLPADNDFVLEFHYTHLKYR